MAPTAATSCGRSSSRPPGSMKSSNRSSARSNSRCSQSMHSPLRRRSTPLIIALLSSTKRGPLCGRLPDYEEAVRRAGGEVRVLNAAADSPADVLSTAQGLLLTGGGDVRPGLYGATAHPTFDPAEPGRDEYEIALVRLALEKDIPVFAICRGVQLLNVARGGTLIQDIPDEVGTTVNHRVPMPPHSMAHEVWIESSSLLERLMGERFE